MCIVERLSITAKAIDLIHMSIGSIKIRSRFLNYVVLHRSFI